MRILSYIFFCFFYLRLLLHAPAGFAGRRSGYQNVRSWGGMYLPLPMECGGLFVVSKFRLHEIDSETRFPS